MLDDLANRELVDRLRKSGFGKLVDAILSDPACCYTKRTGRLNKSATGRKIKWRPSKMEEALLKCREILASEI